MKKLKNNQKALELVIKSKSKLYGYKTVSGFVYKMVNDYLFIILIGINYINKNINVNIEYKPIVLDEIFWEIFNLKENKNKPLSFHVNGAFTAKTMNIKTFELEYDNENEAESKFEEIINISNEIIEKYEQKLNNINNFYLEIQNNENQYLNIILLDILKKNSIEALGKINDCIKNYKTGGFMGDNGKSIIMYAKEYCEKNI